MTDGHNVIRIQIPKIFYSELLDLLERNIRSERARANAFRSRADYANASSAEARRDRYAEIRDDLHLGYLHRDELDD